MPANPEAIAWYLTRSEALLGDLREQVRSLRVRGGQIAGFSGAVLALAGANVASVLDDLHGAARDSAGIAFLAGVLLLVAALVTALRGTLVPELFSEISVKEVANFNSERFTNEPDLWRIHMRTIRGLVRLIELTTIQGDQAARAARRAEYLFLAGLLAVGTALAILISVVTL
jgi:cytochrome c biogenesis factor